MDTSVSSPTPDSASPPPPDPYAALRIRDYQLFFGGGILSAAGNQIVAVAVGWAIYHRTGSYLALGMVGLIQFLPVLLLAPITGSIADRFDRRRIVLAMQGVFAVSNLGLAWIAWTQADLRLMYGCLLLSAIGRAFHWPARIALMPTIVPREALANAVTWSTNGFQVAAAMGPTLGGFLIWLDDSAAIAFCFAAATALVFGASVWMLRSRTPARAREPVTLASMLAGLSFVLHRRILLAAISLDLFAVLLGGATAMLPVFARDLLHVGPAGFGWLRAAPAIGAVICGLLLAHRAAFLSAGRLLLAVVTGFGLATIAFGYSTSFVISFVALMCCGAFDNVSVVIRHTLMQLATPDEMRGRVAAVNTVFVSSSNELGEFESGLVAEFCGPIFSVVSGGVGTILVVLVVGLLCPDLRRLRRLEDVRAVV